MKCILGIQLDYGRYIVKYLELDPQPKVKYLSSSTSSYCKINMTSPSPHWLEDLLSNYLVHN